MNRDEASQLIGKTITWKLLEAMGVVEAPAANPFICAQAGCSATIHKAKGLCVHHYQAMRYEPHRRKAKALPQCIMCQNVRVHWAWQGQAYCTACVMKLQGYPTIDGLTKLTK
jgi:hypothetical protein